MKASEHSADLENLKAYQQYPYASYVSTRPAHQRFKRHLTIGHAKSAARGPGYRPLADSRLFKFNYATEVWEEIPYEPNH